MKKLIPIVLIAAALAAAFLLWQKSSQTAELVAQSTPEIPTTAITNNELLTRIQKATTQAQEGPDPIEGLAELSRLYHANGFTREAWKCYATLAVAEPSEPRWHYHFGRILAGYGQLDEATPFFSQATKLASDYPPVHIRLGDTLLKQNRFEEASNAYADALKLDNSNAYALVGLARVAIANEDWSTARTHLEKAVKVTNNQIGADLLADVYKKLNLPQLENQVLQTIRWGSYADIPDPWSLSLMDDCYDAYQVSIAGGWVAHQGDPRKGLRYIKQAIALDPENSIYHYQVAGIYQSLNDLKNAETHFRRSVEIQPDFADAWLSLINIAQQRQSPTHVRRTLDAALKAAPDSPSLNIERARIFLAQKQFSKAYPYFKKSIKVRPHEAIGYIELAKAYLAENRIDEGIAQIRLALEREPNHPIGLTTMVFDAILRSDQADADEWFARVRKQVRIQDNEVSKLEDMYRKAFGRPAKR